MCSSRWFDPGICGLYVQVIWFLFIFDGDSDWFSLSLRGLNVLDQKNLFWRFICGSGFALRLRRLRKLGRPGISEGLEKDREGGPDENSELHFRSR